MVIKTFKHENFSFPVYKGSLLENMPKIRKNGHRVFSAIEIMMLKVLAKDFNLEFAQYLKENSFLTSSSVIYRQNGDIKFVRVSKSIESLCEKTPLTRDGAIILGQANTSTENISYDSYPDEEKGVNYAFNRIEVATGLYNFGSYMHAMQNKLLNSIVMNNSQLLEEYLDQYITSQNRNLSSIALMFRSLPEQDIERVIRFNSCNNEKIAIDGTIGLNKNNSLILCSHNYS